MHGLALEAKNKNIIEMAVIFTAMIRVLSKGSKAKISERLEQLFSSLELITERQEYERAHEKFCRWFTQNIRTATRRLKNGRVKPSRECSYGQAAKVLDISIKVYVYYCTQPSPEAARRLAPMLHGAVDTPIMQHLASRYPGAGLKSNTIEEIDREEYRRLQRLVNQDIQRNSQSEILPVQYDDIMWRRLNRT